MSKKKKVFLIVYVTILISIVIFLLNKIIAAENNNISLNSSPQTDKIAKYSAEEVSTQTETTIPGSFPAEYANAEAYANSFIKNGVYIEDLTKYNGSEGEKDLYCFDKYTHVYGKTWRFSQPLYREKKDDKENRVLIKYLNEDDTEYRGDIPPLEGYDYCYDYYISRTYDWSGIHVTKNDSISADQSSKNCAAAYILSKNNEYGKMHVDRENTKAVIYYNERQYALWEILKSTNSRNYKTYMDIIEEIEGRERAHELYDKAVDFGDYREHFEKPALKATNSQYKFEYNTSGDYFIAGPITITYTQLQLKTGDIVGIISNPELYYKTDEDSKPIAMDQSNFDITDESGNHIDLPKDRKGIYILYKGKK